jgi:aryl-alcohol dehydrogenase-like predicted oxidoreductase
MVHWPIHPHSIRHFTSDDDIINNPPDAAEAFKALKRLQSQGKIRYVGVSNFAKPALEQIRNFGVEIVLNELPYSLLTRAIEWDTLPYCRDNGIGVIGYMTLLQGLLADVYPTLSDVPAWQRRTRHFNCESCELCRHNQAGAEDQTNAALAKIRAIASEADMTVPQIAVKWALAGDGITCVLIGARNVKELEANVRAASEPLTLGIIERLNEATKPLMLKLGHSLDYYEATENDRTVLP